MDRSQDLVVLQTWSSGYRRVEEPDSNPPEVVLESPPDFVVWSLFNAIFSPYFCCLGFVSLIYSIKSRDQKRLGDLEVARHYGATAKQFNIFATLFLLLAVVATALYIWI